MFVRLLFLCLSWMGLAQGTFAGAVDPLPADQQEKLKSCYAQEIAKVEVVNDYEVSADINCDKAEPPSCDTKTDSKSVTRTAPSYFTILTAVSRRVKANHARDVGISEATISPDRRTASATLTCRGWGCEPDKGGSPGTGYVSGTEQRHALRHEISAAIALCAERIRTGG